jgi:hypothetical protein
MLSWRPPQQASQRASLRLDVTRPDAVVCVIKFMLLATVHTRALYYKKGIHSACARCSKQKTYTRVALLPGVWHTR